MGESNFNELLDNLKQNAIPENIFEMETEEYQKFLIERRKLMSNKMREFYQQL